VIDQSILLSQAANFKQWEVLSKFEHLRLLSASLSALLLVDPSLQSVVTVALIALCRGLSQFKHSFPLDVAGSLLLISLLISIPTSGTPPPVSKPMSAAKPTPHSRDDLLSSLSSLTTSSRPLVQSQFIPVSAPAQASHKPFTTLIRPEPVHLAPPKFAFDPLTFAAHQQQRDRHVNPFSSIKLKPARLNVERPSGLEQDLSSFRLSDDGLARSVRRQVKSVSPPFVDLLQGCLTLGLLAIRVLLRRHPPLICLLLAAGFCWRGWQWERVHRHPQLARFLDALIGARLFWLSLSLLERLNGQVEQCASICVDLLIIAVR